MRCKRSNRNIALIWRAHSSGAERDFFSLHRKTSGPRIDQDQDIGL